MFNGIDVSKHQGKIDWQKVKDSGIDFAIIRAGFGKNNIDEYAHYNALRCNMERRTYPSATVGRRKKDDDAAPSERSCRTEGRICRSP